MLNGLSATMKQIIPQSLHLSVDLSRALIFFLVIQLLLQVVQGSQVSFSLHLTRADDTSVLFRWTDLPMVPKISFCEFYVSESGDTEFHSQPRFVPDSGNKILSHLQSSTVYKVFMSCRSGEVSYLSSTVNFTTAPNGEYYTVPQPSATTFEVSATTADPEVTKTRMSQASAVLLDVAMGICFALMGLGIIIAMFYYIGLKFRRQQRIQRFLQYRQHENHPFPDFVYQQQNNGEEE